MVFCDRHPFFGASSLYLETSTQTAEDQALLLRCTQNDRGRCVPRRDQKGIGARQRLCTLTLSLQSHLSLLHSHQEVFRKVLSFCYYRKAIPDVHHFLRRKDGKTVFEVSAKDFSMTVGILFYFSSFGIQ